MCNIEVSLWLITKCRNYRVLNLDEFEIYRDFCTAQKDYAYIVMLCKGKFRATVWKRRCEKNVVRKALWKRHCEKDVVRETLWERRCKKVVVRRIFLLTCFFLLTNIRVKKCLPRLGALHLWCLCFNVLDVKVINRNNQNRLDISSLDHPDTSDHDLQQVNEDPSKLQNKHLVRNRFNRELCKGNTGDHFANTNQIYCFVILWTYIYKTHIFYQTSYL